MVWNGEMYNLTGDESLTMENFNIEISEDSIILLNQGSTYGLDYQVDRFQHFVGDSISIREKKCELSVVETSLQRINKASLFQNDLCDTFQFPYCSKECHIFYT